MVDCKKRKRLLPATSFVILTTSTLWRSENCSWRSYLMRGLVQYAAKYKNPRLLESGMNCFMGILRGPHLVAHTWANRPTLIWAFSGRSPMPVTPFVRSKIHLAFFVPDQDENCGNDHDQVGYDSDEIVNNDVKNSKWGYADQKRDLYGPLVILETEDGQGILQIT